MNGSSSVPSLSTGRSSTSISQQSTLVGSDAFRGAVLKFKNGLLGAELTAFQSTTYESLCHEILRLQHAHQHTKTMANFARLQSFLEAMHQFSKTIEIYLNTSDVLAFVWGPIKFVLLVRDFDITFTVNCN